MKKKHNYIIALDQGTTSSRAIIFDKEGNKIGESKKELTQIYPKEGWIEHDPMEIWDIQKNVMLDVLEKSKIIVEDISGIGIANQRETTIVWDKNNGKPIYNAIVWQCRRTSDICDELKSKGLEQLIKAKTGLLIDSYFSATKIKWILDNVKGAREKANRGELLFGTVDTWLIWNLTKGKIHATDYSNASRTMLYNIDKLDWDKEILEELNIPKSMLPTVYPSSYIYGYTNKSIINNIQIPIAGCAGDQQAALFGQTCFDEGSAKVTYGTGCFMVMNTGEKRIDSQNGLISTIAWGIDGKIKYALEGSIFSGGSSIQWLRDELKLINNSSETEKYANYVNDNNGIYIVPAFTGLGAPYWNMHARGTITGLTRCSTKEHLVRATLESIAYQTKDILNIMEKDYKLKINEIKVDGGVSVNNFLMQFQADILNTNINRPQNIEVTALGVAYLAGLATGLYKSKHELKRKNIIERKFVPNMNTNKRNLLCNGWKRAVNMTLSWAQEQEKFMNEMRIYNE